MINELTETTIRVLNPDFIMPHNVRKILSIALVLLLGLNLLPAMAAVQSDCPPEACKGMAVPIMHPNAAPMNADASAEHGCCGTSQHQRCDFGNQDPLDLRDIQAYTVSTTRVNSENSLEMATLANEVFTDNQNFSLPRSDLDANGNVRSSPIYLLILSLLI